MANRGGGGDINHMVNDDITLDIDLWLLHNGG